VFAGDSDYGSHEMAFFAQWRRGRLTLVSRFHPKANLFEPPPVVVGKKNGRPRQKGAKLASPEQVVAGAARTRLPVGWYGGGQRQVEVVTGTGHWYKSGAGLVAVRWVYVHDRTGTHRDDYLFSTDAALTARQIIETYTGRWGIETTFQEARSYLGLETTRGWCKNTVLRAEPCLLGLYTVVALLYWRLPQATQEDWQVVWLGKESMAFSDAITAVRRWLWEGWVFARAGHGAAFEKLPAVLKETLLYGLAPAA
jgi:Archaeal putative transposase ISC1217